MSYWFQKHLLVEVNVADREYRQRNWVGRLRKRQEA